MRKVRAMILVRIGGIVGRFTLPLAGLLFVAHVLGGHLHADAATAVPVDAHEQGDGHHDDGAASCDALRTAAGHVAPVVVAAPLVVPAAPTRKDRWPLALAPTALPFPPLFLLHAALLI
jgi:hypothetical protein